MRHVMLCAALATGIAFAADAGSTIALQPDPAITVGSGSFVIPGGAGREERSIEVHYHRPANLASKSPVLLVIPGAGRNGDDYRDAWREASEQHGVLVLSPSYSEKHYPEYWSYNLGNMPGSVTLDLGVQLTTQPSEWQYGNQVEASDDNDTLERLAQADPLLRHIAVFALSGMVGNVDATASDLTVNQDRTNWIYSDFDRIFAAARRALDLETTQYDAFGHSAGGQILHRLALFHPDNDADRIVAANSGWYTVPDLDRDFPYGLKGTGMSEDEIGRAFSRNLVVLLGEKDDESETRGSLRRTPEAMEQGPGRIQRGRYFFKVAAETARKIDAELNWIVEIVPGVGHEYRRMATATARLLYGAQTDVSPRAGTEREK